MTFSVWIFLAIVAVLLGVLSVAIRYSLKLFWAAIVVVFAVLSIASISTGDDLLWGLDSFPLDVDPPAGMSIVLTIAYVSMLGSVGILWFRAFLLRDIDSKSQRIALTLSAIAIAAQVLLVGYLHLWDLRAAGDTSANLLSARTWQVDSQASSVRAVICLLIGFPIQHWYARKDPNVEKNRWFVITGGLLALGSLTVVGHTAYQPPTWVSHGVDFLHGVGASLWFGGLLGLALYLRHALRTREDVVTAGRVLTAFSTWGLYSVIMLGFSGSVMGVMVKDDAFDVTGSPFAQMLSVKLVLVVIPVALAAYNRFKLMPGLEADPHSPDAWAKLRKTTFAEIAALLVILVITGMLVVSSPVAS